MVEPTVPKVARDPHPDCPTPQPIVTARDLGADHILCSSRILQGLALEVGQNGCLVAEGLVGTHGVVVVDEDVELDGQGVAVADVGAVEMFVLGGAEESLDDAVGLGCGLGCGRA